MELLKKLRGISGAPIKDCKKAIEECGENLDDALEWMKKQGTLVRGKRADQDASQGLVGIAFGEEDTAALLEISTETDSAARIDLFHDLVKGVACSLLESQNSESGSVMDTSSLESLSWTGDSKEGSNTVKEAVAAAVLQVRENIFPRRGVRLHVPNGVVAGYVHNVLKTEVEDVKMGAIGVLVGLSGVPVSAKKDAHELAYKIAMHVAAAKPEFLSREDISEEQRQAQENLLTEIAKSEGKPEKVVAKMVQGRMQKYFQDTCLLDQTYLIHSGEETNPPTIKKLLKSEGEKMSCSEPLEIAAFHCFRLGEKTN
eukprot:CAMPEP_0114523728 /NCGR_PEP_ID=MMETSP0109-20121206/21449_1 /TAXON_ID=29199 /ORGANISM="Chlorarachnion reptans, Strain CCCM449" /LENGTH=313 /DNA_ID=CAMNT_0001705069 /DNA_START=416 /DNA_END=1357 /DNA_ORIENTATION=+